MRRAARSGRANLTSPRSLDDRGDKRDSGGTHYRSGAGGQSAGREERRIVRAREGERATKLVARIVYGKGDGHLRAAAERVDDRVATGRREGVVRGSVTTSPDQLQGLRVVDRRSRCRGDKTERRDRRRRASGSAECGRVSTSPASHACG